MIIPFCIIYSENNYGYLSQIVFDTLTYIREQCTVLLSVPLSFLVQKFVHLGRGSVSLNKESIRPKTRSFRLLSSKIPVLPLRILRMDPVPSPVRTDISAAGSRGDSWILVYHEGRRRRPGRICSSSRTLRQLC